MVIILSNKQKYVTEIVLIEKFIGKTTRLLILNMESISIKKYFYYNEISIVTRINN